jgi:hypothetical protein
MHEPVLTPLRISELRPTQMTVGLREVAEKRREWRERSGGAEDRFLGRHMIPVVMGPRGRPYVIDHHHLVLALHDEGVQDILVDVVADLSSLKRAEFWVFLDNRHWCHPYDVDGDRRPFDDIPRSITDMRDDPYRSLAGALRRAGGYAKESTPFGEFIWADFLRRRVRRKTLDKDFERALTKALVLARASSASYMPGWCGPSPG